MGAIAAGIAAGLAAVGAGVGTVLLSVTRLMGWLVNRKCPVNCGGRCSSVLV